MTEERDERLRIALISRDVPEIEHIMQSEFNNDGRIIIKELIFYACGVTQMDWFLRKYKPDLRGSSVLSYLISVNEARSLIRCGADVNCTPSPIVGCVLRLQYDVVRVLLEHGASLKTARSTFTGIDGAVVFSSTSYDRMKLVLDDFTYRFNKCQRTALTLMVLKRKRVLHPDMARVLAKIVWATRRSDVWEHENKNKKL